MSVKLIVDSACDIDRRELVRAGVGFLPLGVRLDGIDYLDGVDLSHDDFFRKLQESKGHPTTSQITPAMFDTVFRRVLGKADEVLYLALSSRCSGTCENALYAQKHLPRSLRSRVHVVDTENISIGEQVIVRYALELLERGLCAQEIEDTINTRKKDVHLYALLDTLEYLRRGGRISNAVAFAGSLLKVKPIICIKEGAVEQAGIARSVKAGHAQLVEYVERAGGIDMTMPYVFAYTGLASEPARTFFDARHEVLGFETATTFDTVPLSSIGAAVGTHIGPGAVGLAFFGQDSK